MKRDVIIVGAGPVGSYLSRSLADKGYRVLLLDRKVETGRHICAGVIGVEAFRRFTLPQESVLHHVRSVTLFSPSGKRLKHSTVNPLAYVVDRMAFDRAILEWALEAGVEFRNFCQVTGVQRVAGEMEVACLRSGKLFQSRASMVIFATGYSPNLLFSIGLPGYPGAVAGIQTVNVMRNVEDVEVYLGNRVAPKGFAWLVPMDGGEVRVGMVVGRGESGDFFSSSSVLSRAVESPGPVRSTLIPKGPIPKTYQAGLLVVGEAAGQVKATTYGGVYYGLICAEHALSTIEEAFGRGNFGEEMLSRYQERWRSELGEELELGSRLRERVAGMGDDELDSLFELLGSDGLMPRLKAAVKFDWHGDIVRLFIRRGLIRGDATVV
jgi:geranylgeranyl reductase family protein